MATHVSAVFGLFSILAFAATGFAAVSWVRSPEDPNFPGQCIWEDRFGSLGRYPPPVRAFQPGESWDIGDCVKAHCYNDGDELFIEFHSCGSASVLPPCILLPPNLSLPYPHCCRMPWCPEVPPEPVDDSLRTNEIPEVNEREPWKKEIYLY